MLRLLSKIIFENTTVSNSYKMKRLIVIFFILGFNNSFSQCIAKEKIQVGGDWSSYDYTYFCPTYEFSLNGDTSKNWSILNPIHIRQITKLILPVKDSVEKRIREYAGDDFYSRMKFHSVEIVYKDSIKKFAGRQPRCISRKCKAKYFFYYIFSPDNQATYNIGIAVNKKGEIISDFKFPAKNEYKPIDSSLTVCEIIKIAKQFNKDIEPIDEVKFDYDETTKRFYWLVSQEKYKKDGNIVFIKQGINEFNQVIIDAVDSKQIKKQIGKVNVDF